MKLHEAKKIVKNYALTPYVYSYKIGSDPKLDAILEEVIKHKEYPIPYVRKFEKNVYEKRVSEINRILEKISRSSETMEQSIKATLEKMKETYLQKIKEIEEKVE